MTGSQLILVCILSLTEWCGSFGPIIGQSKTGAILHYYRRSSRILDVSKKTDALVLISVIFFSYSSLLVLLRHVKTEEPASQITNTRLTNVSVSQVSWESFAREVICDYSSRYSVELLSLKPCPEKHFFHHHVILLIFLCPACLDVSDSSNIWVVIR